ncbi:MAG: response regulator [Pseudomonadota bacterium]|nr:response regulator [Pseudomonadota bacterium]
MTRMTGPRLLVVEDDARLGELLVEYFGSHGFVVAHETRGDRACARVLELCPDVVLLDLMLPGLDGLEVFRRLRPTFTGRVIMLTARRTDVDQIVGLEMGADDYVTKPVDPRLLLARVNAVLRRAAASTQGVDFLRLGPFVIDRVIRVATVGDVALSLTGAEFDLLWHLATRVGQPVSRDELYAGLRGISYDGVDRGMDIHVARLRRKLRDAGADPDLIKSVRGTGYQLGIRR